LIILLIFSSFALCKKKPPGLLPERLLLLFLCSLLFPICSLNCYLLLVQGMTAEKGGQKGPIWLLALR
jgi:hypothetical protein